MLKYIVAHLYVHTMCTRGVHRVKENKGLTVADSGCVRNCMYFIWKDGDARAILIVCVCKMLKMRPNCTCIYVHT